VDSEEKVAERTLKRFPRAGLFSRLGEESVGDV